MPKKTSRTRPKSHRSTPPAKQPIREIPEIPELFLLTTVEQIRSISIPLRLSILRALAEKPMTTKQVAVQLREPITKLYRHVEALADAGLVVLVEKVPKRGTVQKFYRAAARCFKADDACFAGHDYGDARTQAIFNLLDATRSVIAANLRRGSANVLSLAAASELYLADTAQANDLMNAITKALQSWAKSNNVRASKKGSTPYRVAVFVNPATND